MNKVYCYCYRYPLLRLSISQTAVSVEPASSTGKPITGCTDRLCHTILILNIIVGTLLTPDTSACHVTRCLCHQTLSERVVCSRLTRLRHLRRDTDGVTSVQLSVAVLTTSACAHHRFIQRQPVPIIGSYNVRLCPSSVFTSACAHHRFLQRQPVPIISSYNVSLCPSSVPSTSEYFPLIVFERECSYIEVNKADLWRLSQAAV